MARKPIWVQAPPRGWVLYDADCGFCTRWAWRLARFVGPRGFHLAPLQAPWVRQKLALSESELLHEMRVLTADDALYGGADAFLFLARQIWWALPFAALAWIPGVMPLARASYRWIASHRHAISSTCELPRVTGGQTHSPVQPPSRASGA
jgi:predicted DCC family thiol-disulfide oxidoreductase YuxK